MKPIQYILILLLITPNAFAAEKSDKKSNEKLTVDSAGIMLRGADDLFTHAAFWDYSLSKEVKTGYGKDDMYLLGLRGKNQEDIDHHIFPKAAQAKSYKSLREKLLVFKTPHWQSDIGQQFLCDTREAFVCARIGFIMNLANHPAYKELSSKIPENTIMDMTVEDLNFREKFAHLVRNRAERLELRCAKKLSPHRIALLKNLAAPLWFKGFIAINLHKK